MTVRYCVVSINNKAATHVRQLGFFAHDVECDASHTQSSETRAPVRELIRPSGISITGGPRGHRHPRDCAAAGAGAASKLHALTVQQNVAQAVINALDPKGISPLPTVSAVFLDTTGSYALAVYARGNTGGEAGLKLQGKAWKIITSGGGVVSLGTLEHAGMPTASAQSLIAQRNVKYP
mgnify:CR=1 FL=1